jgi:vacuolar-type H+-ATPase subunit E/Vma4
MKAFGSVAAVVAAVREDAALEADAIERQAEAAIARLRDEAAARRVVWPEGETRIVAARERARARVAHEDWLDSRAAIDEREAWIARAVERGRRQLVEAPYGRQEWLATLAEEAIERLHARAVQIAVSAADAPLLDADWRAAVAAPARLDALEVIVDAVDGGCRVRSSDGRATVDNTLAARAHRFQTAWRAALAELYERAVQEPARDTTGERSRG